MGRCRITSLPRDPARRAISAEWACCGRIENVTANGSAANSSAISRSGPKSSIIMATLPATGAVGGRGAGVVGAGLPRASKSFEGEGSDGRSVEEKGAWGAMRGLAGTPAWTLESDGFTWVGFNRSDETLPGAFAGDCLGACSVPRAGDGCESGGRECRRPALK